MMKKLRRHLLLLRWRKVFNFTDLEKKKFMQSFIEEVQIYEQPKENGRFLKSISFAFPVYYNDKEFTTIAFGEDALKEYADNLTKENLVGWDKEITAETVCCLYHQKKDFISVPYEPKNVE